VNSWMAFALGFGLGGILMYFLAACLFAAHYADEERKKEMRR
jgi:hypothetical protein